MAISSIPRSPRIMTRSSRPFHSRTSMCRAGLAWIEHEFANAYRPTPDNPLPYSDLVERLGVGHPLMAVQWFALQGNLVLRPAKENRLAEQSDPQFPTCLEVSALALGPVDSGAVRRVG